MPSKLTTRMPPPQHPLPKNAEFTDYYLPSNHLLSHRVETTVPHARLIQVGPLIPPTCSGSNNKEQSTICPTAQAGTWLPGNVAGTGSLPFSKSLPFPTAYKSSQEQPGLQSVGSPSFPVCSLPCAGA